MIIRRLQIEALDTAYDVASASVREIAFHRYSLGSKPVYHQLARQRRVQTYDRHRCMPLSHDRWSLIGFPANPHRFSKPHYLLYTRNRGQWFAFRVGTLPLDRGCESWLEIKKNDTSGTVWIFYMTNFSINCFDKEERNFISFAML